MMVHSRDNSIGAQSREGSPALDEALEKPPNPAPLPAPIEIKDDDNAPLAALIRADSPVGDPPAFNTWASFEEHILALSDPVHNRSFFHLRANNSQEAVVGLVDFVSFRRQNPTGPYVAGPNVHRTFRITPATIALSDIFSYNWCFKA
jgi:hypothetical protein